MLLKARWLPHYQVVNRDSYQNWFISENGKGNKDQLLEFKTLNLLHEMLQMNNPDSPERIYDEEQIFMNKMRKFLADYAEDLGILTAWNTATRTSLEASPNTTFLNASDVNGK